MSHFKRAQRFNINRKRTHLLFLLLFQKHKQPERAVQEFKKEKYFGI